MQAVKSLLLFGFIACHEVYALSESHSTQQVLLQGASSSTICSEIRSKTNNLTVNANEAWYNTAKGTIFLKVSGYVDGILYSKETNFPFTVSPGDCIEYDDPSNVPGPLQANVTVKAALGFNGIDAIMYTRTTNRTAAGDSKGSNEFYSNNLIPASNLTVDGVLRGIKVELMNKTNIPVSTPTRGPTRGPTSGSSRLANSFSLFMPCLVLATLSQFIHKCEPYQAPKSLDLELWIPLGQWISSRTGDPLERAV